MLAVSLVTLGSPDQLTGGYLYHRRLAELAPRHDAHLDLVPVPALPGPLPAAMAGRALRRAAQADVIVVDSIVAAFLVPWRPWGGSDPWGPGGPSGTAPPPGTGRPPWRRRPLAAMLHQPPGGIDHGPVRSRVQARLDRALYRGCDLVMLASGTLEDATLGFPTVVVPPGSDVAGTAALRGGPTVDLRHGRAIALLNVGNWVERKGTLDLLDAVGRLPDDRATLHLVGRTDIDGRYASRVRARLERPDLAGRVVVHGPVSREEVAVLYRSADVFVLPSYREPYGTAYGEAMATGLPVVGWRAGNLPHLADHGREGVVLEPGDVTGLADALRRLADDPAERERLAAGARRRAADLPTWDDTARQFFGLLRDLAVGTSP